MGGDGLVEEDAADEVSLHRLQQDAVLVEDLKCAEHPDPPLIGGGARGRRHAGRRDGRRGGR